MKTQVNIKIDVDVKEAAQKRAKEIGLSLSSVMNSTLKQFARDGELHLYPIRKMSPKLEKIIEEGRKEFLEGKTVGFDNVDDMMNYLNSHKE